MNPIPRPRPAGSFRHLVTSLLLLAGAGSHLPGQDRLDRSLPIELISSPNKGDVRNSLAQFGLRPTLVVVPCRNDPGEDLVARHSKALAQVDRIASKWRRAGGEVVCLDPGVLIETSPGRREDVQILKKARLKNTICAKLEEDQLGFVLESDVRRQVFDQPSVGELEYRWVLLGAHATVTATGQDLFADDVLSRIDASDVSDLTSDRASARVFDAINEWRLADAQSRLAKMQSKHPEQAEQLQKILADTVSRYRQIHCEPLEQNRLLPELSSVLEYLAESAGKRTAIGSAVVEEIEEIRAREDFDEISAYRDSSRAMLKLMTDAEEAVGAAYTKALQGRSGYDEVLYNQQIVQLYPPVLEQVARYVKENQHSPYRREVAVSLMDYREDLQYARTVAGGGRD